MLYTSLVTLYMYITHSEFYDTMQEKNMIV